MRCVNNKIIRKAKNKFSRLSRRNRFAALLLVALLVIPGAYWVVAERGGYGTNGPETSPNTLDLGLVGYWDMEEGSGQTVYDKSGNGNTGTLGANSSAGTDDPVFGPGHDATGEKGTAIKLDGIDDYVDAGSGSSLSLANNFTICFRAKPNGLGEDKAMLSKASAYKVDTNITGYLRFTTLGVLDYVSTFQPQVDVWYHACVILDSSNDANFYINGSLRQTVTGTNPALTNSNPVLLGKYGTKFFDGTLDDIRIYNRALSADEIRLLYNEKKPVLEMKFEEGSGTVAHDESFNHNDGTIGGAVWTEGKSGTALSFDGTDDYVNAGNGASLSSPHITVSAWVYKTRTAGTTYDQPILLKGDSTYTTSASTSYALTFGWGTDFNWRVRFSDDTNYSLPIPGGVSNNAWHHIVGTYDGTTIAVYLDGVLKNSNTSYGGKSLKSVSNNLMLGFLGTYKYQGYIDSVRVYNYGRTADEVLADYNDGLAAHLGKNKQDLNRGLVGYWDMEEGGGQTAGDKSGNGRNATLGSTASADGHDPVFSSGFSSGGPKGMGLKFDGGNDYANMGDVSGADWANVSTSAWIYWAEPGFQGYAGVYFKGSTSDLGRLLILNDTGQLLIQNGNGDFFSSSGAIARNQWTHVAYVYNQTAGQEYLYVNGVLKGQKARTGNIVQNSTEMWTGYGHSAATHYVFSGSIDEVRVYDRALSDDEIRFLYNEKKPILEMKFDEDSGTVAHDESFNHNDGILGEDGEGTDVPVWTTGRNVSGLSFDGGDKVAVSDNPVLDISDNLTISFWINPAADFVGYAAHPLTKYTGTGDATFALYYFGTTSGTNRLLRFYANRGGSWGSISGSYTLALNTWYHVELVYNSGTGGKLYVNGQYTGTSEGSGVLALNNAKIFVGTELSGKMDEVKVYNYARTADEVLADYNAGLGAHLGENNQGLDRGLKGYWDMEEGSGLTVYDKSGNGNNGTLMTSSATELAKPFFAAGHDSRGENGMGLGLTGRSEYVNAGTGSSLQLTSAGTIALWVKANSLDQDDFANFVTRRSDTTGGTPANHSYSFHWRGSEDLIRLAFSDGTALDIATMPLPTDLNWHHMVGLWDGTNLKLYMDGALAMTPVAQTRNAQAGAGFTTAIGGYSFSTSAVGRQEFNGTLDEIRVYDRALSDDEIRMLYNQKRPVVELKFEEGAGTAARDESFNGNDGTLTGATWVEGRSGGALSCDGTDDYLKVNSASSMNLTEDYTLSMWVYNRAGAKPNPTLLNKEAQSTTNGFFWIYTSGTNGNVINFQHATGAATPTNSFGGALSLNSWTHLSFTFENATKSLKLFVNGQQFSTTRTLTGALPVDGGDLYLGTYQGLLSNYPFYGYLDDFRLYDYARTPGEVQVDYNDGLAAHLR